MKKLKLGIITLLGLVLTACGGAADPTQPVSPSTPAGPTQPASPSEPTGQPSPSDPGVPSTPGSGEIQSITLSDTRIELKEGETHQLTATTVPEGIEVVWESLNTSVATVENGLVTAVKEGVAAVTVTSKDGKKRAACTVTVIKEYGDVIPVTGVSISQSEMRIGLDATISLTAAIAPNNATDKSVIWATSEDNKAGEDKIIELSASGSTATITAKAIGAATVYVYSNDGGFSDECIINVVESDTENCVIKEETTVNIWATFNDTYRTLIENAIAELSVEEPFLNVVYTKKSGSYNDIAKMVTDDFATNGYPNIVALYPDSVAEFIDAGKSLDMTPYMENPDYGWSDDDFDDVYESYIEEGQQYSIPGTYSLPAAKSTEAMYYDGGKLLGINLSEIDSTINNGRPLTEQYLDNLTWEDLLDHLAPALVQYNESLPEGSKIINQEYSDEWAVIGYDSDDNLFITLAEQYGYGYTGINEITGQGEILFNNPEMKGLMKKIVEAHDNHYLTTKALLGGTTYVNTLSNHDAVLFSVGSTGGVSYQFDASNPKDVRVAHIPQAAGKASKVISQGPSFAFLDHNDENQAIGAWLFYKKFAEPKFSTPWSMTTGYSPIRASIASSDDWIEYSDVDSTSIKTVGRLLARNANYASSVGDDLFSSPVFKGSGTARQQVGSIISALVMEFEKAGKVVTDDALNEVFQTAYNNTILKM